MRIISSDGSAAEDGAVDVDLVPGRRVRGAAADFTAVDFLMAGRFLGVAVPDEADDGVASASDDFDFRGTVFVNLGS